MIVTGTVNSIKSLFKNAEKLTLTITCTLQRVPLQTEDALYT